ncbi:MAG: hypothetical protein ACR2JE_06640 [Acidobacteriaceae bacterium]
MSTATVAVSLPPMTPVYRRVRGYFAPVVRATGSPTIFDPSQAASFQLDAPPAPWIDLGYLRKFARTSGTKVMALEGGSPRTAQLQARDAIGSTISLQFEQWTKLTMTLAAGAQHMNVLAATGQPGDGIESGSGSSNVVAAAPLLAQSSTASFLAMDAASLPGFEAGDIVAVDEDYTGQQGFVGAGASTAYLRSAAAVASDPHYIRRVTLNVARVAQVTSTGLQLATPLPAGSPTTAMKVQPAVGFVDREGGTFFHEWSAIFAMGGEQGEVVFLHYPRLQAMAGSAESLSLMMDPLTQVLLSAEFRALPVTDPIDGEQVCCFRTFVPASNSLV